MPTRSETTFDRPFPALTAAQRYHLDVHGYVVVEEVLTADEVALLRQALRELRTELTGLSDPSPEGPRVVGAFMEMSRPHHHFMTNLTDLGPEDGGTVVIAGSHKVDVPPSTLIELAYQDPSLIHQVIAPAGSTLFEGQAHWRRGPRYRELTDAVDDRPFGLGDWADRPLATDQAPEKEGKTDG